ncbi:hypothetical protein SAMN04489730_7565 [Amycolatopsis australiensis]|uniref:HTH-like domain-containing protein n=1 Tax=Amycolatopsis australiensis TaxID=546364 RepID=A0A1K1T1P8_9PSEU|nr:hypothetical protein SAMN04489730_7565 [Amycolatopsis australiensis]
MRRMRVFRLVLALVPWTSGLGFNDPPHAGAKTPSRRWRPLPPDSLPSAATTTVATPARNAATASAGAAPERRVVQRRRTEPRQPCRPVFQARQHGAGAFPGAVVGRVGDRRSLAGHPASGVDREPVDRGRRLAAAGELGGGAVRASAAVRDDTGAEGYWGYSRVARVLLELRIRHHRRRLQTTEKPRRSWTSGSRNGSTRRSAGSSARTRPAWRANPPKRGNGSSCIGPTATDSVACWPPAKPPITPPSGTPSSTGSCPPGWETRCAAKKTAPAASTVSTRC